MTTKVFISWSGDLSNELAEAIRQWLPGVLQAVRPYFTPNDVEKGTRWSSDIAAELESSDIGIICLTRDNLTQPWILFEAGALSKNLETSQVCTLLFGVDSSDVKGPLTIFQNTKFEKDDFKKLIRTINQAGGEDKLNDTVLNDVFEKWWVDLETKVGDILKNHQGGEETPDRSARDILEEILELSRYSAKNKSSDRRISTVAYYHLAEYAAELQKAVEIDGTPDVVKASKRLTTPLVHILRKVGNPLVIERYENALKDVYSWDSSSSAPSTVDDAANEALDPTTQ